MTGYTARYALPYPEADTLISVSAPIVQELAEKIELIAMLNAREPAPAYTIPAPLLATLTTSGTWTPPGGVTRVTAVIVGGGATGSGSTGDFIVGNYSGGNGGTGGQVVVADIDVSGPVAYTIGGADTATTFAGVTAIGGREGSPTLWGQGRLAAEPVPHNLGRSRGGQGGYRASNGAETAPGAGQDGVTINYQGGQVVVAGGGGGGTYGFSIGPVGGAGGGGQGGSTDGNNTGGVSGSNGTGGGGGGATTFAAGFPGSVGGSGVVYLFATDQTTRDTTAPIDPVIMAALDDGVMVGAYAIDPVAPVDTLGALIPYPDSPQPTGEEWTDEETGETHPVLAWPCAGWTYNDGEWSPPND